MSVLDKNLEPAVAYSEVYAQGSVYIMTQHIEIDRSTETPFIRQVTQHSNTDCINLSINGYINEMSVETMIAHALSMLFNTDCVVVQRATQMWPDSDSLIESFVAMIGVGSYNGNPISSCKIVLRRRSHGQPNPSHST